METDKLLHRELTYKIIGILFKIHNKPVLLCLNQFFWRKNDKDKF